MVGHSVDDIDHQLDNVRVDEDDGGRNELQVDFLHRAEANQIAPPTFTVMAYFRFFPACLPFPLCWDDSRASWLEPS